MTIVLPMVREMSVGQRDTLTVDFTPWLRRDLGELLASVTFAEQTTTDLSLTNKAASTIDQEILEHTSTAGTAAVCFVSGQKSGVTYLVDVTGTTTATPARVLPITVVIKGV